MGENIEIFNNGVSTGTIVPPALIICNPNNGFAERFRKMFVLSNIEYVGVTHIGAEHA